MPFSLGLIKEFRGKVLGTELLSKTLAHAKSIGLEKIELSVYSENDAAIKLYKKCGFREIGFVKNYRKLNGRYFDCIEMEFFSNTTNLFQGLRLKGFYSEELLLLMNKPIKGILSIMRLLDIYLWQFLGLIQRAELETLFIILFCQIRAETGGFRAYSLKRILTS